MKEELKKFTLPLQPNEVEWKIQSVTKDKSKTLIVPYIDNRAVMARLDDAFGMDGWSSHIHAFDEGFICTITIGNISKSDGSDKSDIEPIKGGISNAMKRCATQWGLGRELYNYPKVYLTGEVKYIPDAVLERLSNMVKAYNDGKLDKSVYVI